jgi:hypothetical protein
MGEERPDSMQVLAESAFCHDIHSQRNAVALRCVVATTYSRWCAHCASQLR